MRGHIEERAAAAKGALVLVGEEATMHSIRPTESTTAKTINDGLAEAAAAAGYAPSIQNTQPWRWRLAGNELDLYVERGRILTATDPDSRLATLSCGAALHHARTVLSAEGWHATVDRMPDAADQDHLARIRVDRSAAVDPQAVRHVRTIPLRHTNRRPVTGAPVGPEDLRAITEAMHSAGGRLLVLKPDQLLDLAAAADQAQLTETGEAQWRADLAYWTSGSRSDGAGVASVAPQSTIPDQPGVLAISARQDRAALFAILYGDSDEPRDWLRAGEALSAGWLTATERGVSVLPISAPVEVVATRDTLRRLLSYLNHPFLVLRFGTGDAISTDAPYAPRQPTDQIIQT
jgi:nitroreductase